MSKLNARIISISTTIIALCCITFLFKFIKLNLPLTENISVALIGALVAFVTIPGAVWVAVVTANKNAHQQRSMELRQLKREYYNKLEESIVERFSYSNNNGPLCKELLDFDLKFAIEVSRTPLYASEKIIKFLNNCTNNTSNISFAELNNLIREDILSDEILPFKEASTRLELYLPPHVIRTNLNSDV